MVLAVPDTYDIGNLSVKPGLYVNIGCYLFRIIYFISGIESMIPQLNKLIEESRHNSGSNHPLTRMDVVHSIIKTPITSELRFQGVNLAGADLNRLDLRYINFKVSYSLK